MQLSSLPPSPTAEPIEQTVASLKSTFLDGITLPLEFRIEALKKLKSHIKLMEQDILHALQLDLGKSHFEAYSSEIAYVCAEIDYCLTHLRRWVKPQKVSTPLFLKPAKSFIIYEPKGVVLILGAWNYPFQLTIAPLVAAIAAGNTAVVKPPELAIHTEKVTDELIKRSLPSCAYRSILGGPQTAQKLTEQKFDHIFFTGSTHVGRLVMKAAAENLTPVTLELGGKSPCIVDKNVDVSIAAKRIVWAKFYNAGQTCIAPDYVLVDEGIRSAFVAEMTNCITKFYGADAKLCEQFGRIISESHFDRLVNLLQDTLLLSGGKHDRLERYIEPTLVEPLSLSAPIMAQEIFGPILPIISVKNVDEAIKIVRTMPTPLACYAFSFDKDFLQKIQTRIVFGGGCFNAAMLHVANMHLPFGGVGTSGFGRYHGEAGFRELSNQKSILADSLRFDLAAKYPPYKGGLKLIKLLLR